MLPQFFKLLGKINYRLSPYAVRQKTLLDACNDANIDLIFKLIDSGATLEFYKPHKVKDPAFMIKIFLHTYENRAHWSDFLDKIGGITKKMLVEEDVYHYPLMEWLVRQDTHGPTAQQKVLSTMVSHTKEEEVLFIMQEQLEKLLFHPNTWGSSHLADFHAQLAKDTLSELQIRLEKIVLDKILPDNKTTLLNKNIITPKAVNTNNNSIVDSDTKAQKSKKRTQKI